MHSVLDFSRTERRRGDGNAGSDENPVPLIGGKKEDQGKEIEQ